MKRLLLILVLAAFTAVGCTGSFNLTKKVYNLHRSQEDKWKDEFIFLVVAILPIYSIATLADAIIFNSIEFWTGENPVVSKPTDQIRYVKEGATEATVAFNPQTEELTIASEKTRLVLDKTTDMVLAKNDKGEVLYSSMKTEDGGIIIYDQNLKPIKSYSAKEIAAAKDHYSR